MDTDGTRYSGSVRMGSRLRGNDNKNQVIEVIRPISGQPRRREGYARYNAPRTIWPGSESVILPPSSSTVPLTMT